MIKPKKAIPESGDNFAYKKCEKCGKLTKFEKENPSRFEVYIWLDYFQCSCGFKTNEKRLLVEEKRKLFKKYSESGIVAGKENLKKRWEKKRKMEQRLVTFRKRKATIEIRAKVSQNHPK